MNLTGTSILFLLIWSAFILWTVGAVWQSPIDREKSRFYAQVKMLSVFATCGMALLLPDVVVLPTLSYWQAVAYWAILAFPVTLWGGYFGFRWFDYVVDRMLKK